MSDKRILGAALATKHKPRVILVGTAGHGSVAKHLHALGWEVVTVPTGENLTCAVLARNPGVVALPVGLDGESGYLVAAKLRTATPKFKVVLFDATRTQQAERFARFLGATFVATSDGESKLVEAITLPAEALGRDCA